MKAIKYITGIVLIVCVHISCKPLQTVQQPGMKPMPASFNNNTDTVTDATVNWKTFFADKNLTSLIDSALLNNWDVQIALQRIQAAKSNILYTKGLLQPNVNTVVSAGINKYGLHTMDGAGNKYTPIYDDGKNIPEHLPDYFAGLQTSWEIDIWGKLKNQKKAALARFLSTIEGKNLVITGLITEIAATYYELMALDETVKILNETIAIQERAYQMVKVQKEAAVTTELAVKQFEAQLLNLRASRLNAVQQITEIESILNFLTGRYPQAVSRDTAFFANSLPAQIKTGVPSTMLQNRPDIRQAELELMASKADLISAKAAFYPSLNINGTVGFQAYKVGLLFTAPESIAYGLLLNITAPLINRSAIKAAFNAANAAQLEALYNYQKSIVSGYVEVYNQLRRSNNLQEVFEVKAKETEALAQSIQISEKLFRTGRASYLEVLIAQQNALQAKLALVDTKKSQYLTTVNLYKALGGGWR